jgi:uncharacterized membrane protein YsdA (DUF1294 family)
MSQNFQPVNREIGVRGEYPLAALNVACQGVGVAAPLGGMNLFLVLFAAGFLFAIGAGAATGWLPVWMGAVYGVASLLTAVVYAWDKYRAGRPGRRTPESTLHLLELLGGWPGGLLAQRILRHKNRKFSYKRTFWLIVLLHLGAWGWAIAAGVVG